MLFGPKEGREQAYEEAERGLAAELAAQPALATQAPELVALTERLGATERQAIAAALAGRQAEALDLLHSPEYMEQSRLLCAQADAQSQAVYARLNQRLREHGWSALAFFTVDSAILLFAVGLWWGLGVRLKRWRGVAEQELARRLSTEAQLRQSQKMEALGQMAAGVGHDFKNVLGAIQGYADLALRAAERGDLDRASLDGIRAAAEQGAAVTGALLAFSQKAGPEWAPVDLHALVAQTAELLRPMLPPGVELAFETRVPPEQCRVLGDRTQLQQALVNLAINAGEAMPEGGRVRIALEADDDPQRICLGVSDTGRGIAPEIRERIFEPFFTTKARGQGTGLGLAIVHAIAASHGARIDLSSTPGEGTRLRLCLARERPAPGAPEPPAAVETRSALIAARDPYQGALLASAIGRGGLTTELVADWDGLLAALRRSREGRLDLVLEDGFAGRGPAEYAEALRAGPGLDRVLVLADRGSSAIAEYEEAGCLVLERPLALAEVARLLAGGGAPR
ncbi:MAG: ATP-binding protein [Chromatiaceae bacterium]|nr:ATP-binding protein [Chromatiaceae bacterium]